MKKSFAIATFLGVAGVGGVGVHALSSISFKGSDTLFTITQEVLQPANCPGAVGLTYLGGGSGTGETALTTGAQTVAPMSRFLAGSSAVCTTAAADGFQAQGLVFALDGVGVFGNTGTAGATACQGAAGTNSTCTPTTPNVGFAYNTTVAGGANGTYTFSNWKDVLKILYAGVAHSGAAAGDQGCSGAIRAFLANNYGQNFEVANCATGTCTQIRHIFRRDDSSGTSDIFSQLLGLTSPNNTTNQVQTFFLGADSYCNAFHSTDNSTVNNAGFTVQNQELTAWNAQLAAQGKPPAAVGPSGVAISVQNVAPYDLQDNDPIRRTCQGTGLNATRANEQVCDFDSTLPTKTAGTLGLVLTMVDSNAAGVAIQYGSGLACNNGYILAHFGSVPVFRTAAPHGRSLVTPTCPNGDDPVGDECYVPIDANGNPNCLADSSNVNAPIVNAAPANGSNPANVDGRVYNKYRYVFPVPGGGDPTLALDNTGTGAAAPLPLQRPITGAYYRIHESLGITTGGVSCRKPDMTDQIGCLINASPCSFGYAGRVADQQPGTTAMLINAIPDAQLCIQQFSYPLSRKLYLNTLVGFGASGVNGQELAFASCENNGQGNLATIVSDNNFVALPSTGTNAVNAGKPFAEDFNEQLLCDAGITNTVAPTSNVGLPTVNTVCGNGVTEAFEDCDNGVAGTPTAIAGGNIANGPPGSCSPTCRLN